MSCARDLRLQVDLGPPDEREREIELPQRRLARAQQLDQLAASHAAGVPVAQLRFCCDEGWCGECKEFEGDAVYACGQARATCGRAG